MKKAMPLEWHNNCLANQQNSFMRKVHELSRLNNELHNQGELIDFYAKQIETAEKEGKEKFDSKKYLIKRKEN
jgi:hypothetical protein